MLSLKKSLFKTKTMKHDKQYLNYFLVSVLVVCGYGLYFWILFQFCGLILYFFVCVAGL